ncbi:metal ABC transporter permease [Porphyromonas loveana]|uniref:Zinc/manganese transport system permease protein/zinc transport system permease protein n=1 Tax=Porphyromonas loveana TaxID=1884669 RepID=A0A2U1FSI8_9PORP|nr:metal ABC transporter permease [Porphyromonas loveana]PVZ15125.1 zinc/manganese transport system permease protein/zinc transport system permease protein [Porphyromonas loveana]
MIEALEYGFFRNAILGSLLTAIVCGLLGSYVVARRMVFVSGGITHASFGGIGMGLYLGINPLLSAAGFAVLSALGVQGAARTGLLREDSAIAAFWSLGMALGTLFVALTPGYSTGLSAFLFGNILLVSHTDLFLLSGMALLTIAAFIFGFRTILYTAFDPDFARTRGVRVQLVEMLMSVAIALGIVLSIRLVGIMLLMSLLTLPQSIMNLFTSRFSAILVGSVVLAAVAALIGLWGSYTLGIPSGAFIILVLVCLFLLAKTIKHFVHAQS